MKQQIYSEFRLAGSAYQIGGTGLCCPLRHDLQGSNLHLHPAPKSMPIPCGDSLAGCHTPPDQMEKLLEAGKKYKAYRHWDRIRIGRSQQDITGNGFNAIRFDPRKPAHTIRCMDSNLGMGGAMHWSECRRFSLPEFKRFGSFPDRFVFSVEFEEGIKQIGNCVPPVFMNAIAEYVRYNLICYPSAGDDK